MFKLPGKVVINFRHTCKIRFMWDELVEQFNEGMHTVRIYCSKEPKQSYTVLRLRGRKKKKKKRKVLKIALKSFKCRKIVSMLYPLRESCSILVICWKESKKREMEEILSRGTERARGPSRHELPHRRNKPKSKHVENSRNQ